MNQSMPKKGFCYSARTFSPPIKWKISDGGNSFFRAHHPHNWLITKDTHGWKKGGGDSNYFQTHGYFLVTLWMRETPIWVIFKEWTLTPNLRDSRVTRGNLSRRVTFFSKMAFGECWQVWRVRTTRLGECRRVWRVLAIRLGKCRRVWQVRSTRLGECRWVWRVRATQLGTSAHDKIGRFKHK